jgi:hypothetical protein
VELEFLDEGKSTQRYLGKRFFPKWIERNTNLKVESIAEVLPVPGSCFYEETSWGQTKIIMLSLYSKANAEEKMPTFLNQSVFFIPFFLWK